MPRLRRARSLVQLMLAWFALTLFVGGTANVQAAALRTDLCVAGVAASADGSADPAGPVGAFSGHGGHCLLCLTPALPAADVPAWQEPVAFGHAAPQPAAATAWVRPTWRPATARAPPLQG